MSSSPVPGSSRPGRVGDLHVPDPVGVRGDRRGDVVAVDGQVVEVAQEPTLSAPGSRCTRSMTPTTSAAVQQRVAAARR